MAKQRKKNTKKKRNSKGFKIARRLKLEEKKNGMLE